MLRVTALYRRLAPAHSLEGGKGAASVLLGGAFIFGPSVKGGHACLQSLSLLWKENTSIKGHFQKLESQASSGCIDLVVR